jgi:hypothetical protein
MDFSGVIKQLEEDVSSDFKIGEVYGQASVLTITRHNYYPTKRDLTSKFPL